MESARRWWRRREEEEEEEEEEMRENAGRDVNRERGRRKREGEM